MTHGAKKLRLDGLDIARFVAFVGMVIVNFKVVMLADVSANTHWLDFLFGGIEGKAAATFVVLAGVGTALAFERNSTPPFYLTIIKRSAFLLFVGLINMMIFEADIIHYYAFYFVVGVWLLPLSKKVLLGVTLFIIFLFPALNLVLSYDAGWNWETLSYQGFWTVGGFVRNLSFNGWHPLVPWLGFFTFGAFLAKLNLSSVRQAAILAIVGGVGMMGLAILFATLIEPSTPVIGADVAALMGVSPIPPGPLFMFTGIFASMFTIGICLLIPTRAYSNPVVRTISNTGQLTLTLYLAHILIGMGTIEAMGLIGNADHYTTLGAIILFVALSIGFTYFWRKRFKRGPIEALMRKVTG